ncbi:hypothetical protein PHMEG_00018469 [Phytophthora megakarya]|uniref:Uncharacterized protein n=1 Tax=Phytophthora megakarya TaxID=4795 RepID=A0A225VUU1_9STRA|nr:hypothetical protein PHMEG_00018469 [Phytophthora megakarya]
MTIKEAAVLAAQQGKVEMVTKWIDDLRCDIASLVIAAAENGHEILAMIRSNVPDRCIQVALNHSSKLEIIKLLYSWLEKQWSRREVVGDFVYLTASEGQHDILEFAIEKCVVECWSDVVLTQSLPNALNLQSAMNLRNSYDLAQVFKGC